MTPAKGAKAIYQILAREKIRSSFFLPVEFLKQKPAISKQLKSGRHYIGAAGSEEWWNEPGSLKVQQGEFGNVMMENRRLLKSIGVNPSIRLSADKTLNYLYNCDGEGKTYLVNPTPGTLSRAANLLPGNEKYAGSDKIFQDIMAKARQMPYGLNGYFLVFPTDAPDQRADKFYMLLPLLLQDLKNEGYSFVGVDEMLGLAIPKAAPPKKKALVHKRKKHRK
jgi:peptidoglycan/xylan/chitin deacetylase (PgdA/CDA1 family)